MGQILESVDNCDTGVPLAADRPHKTRKPKSFACGIDDSKFQSTTKVIILQLTTASGSQGECHDSYLAASIPMSLLGMCMLCRVNSNVSSAYIVNKT